MTMFAWLPRDTMSAAVPLPVLSLHAALFALGASAVLIADAEGRIAVASPAASRLLGRELAGIHLTELATPHTAMPLAGYLTSLAASRSVHASAHTITEMRHADGRLLPVQIQGVNALGQAPVDGLILTLVDISSFRQREAELQASLSRDPLTGLPNRQRFAFHVDEILADGDACCVALVDLDQFKAINDGHGHLVGDEILRAVARRLNEAMPKGAAVLRFGGDEFGLLLPGSVDEDMLATIEDIRRRASAPLAIGNVIVTVGLSIGVTALKGYGLDEALRECDVAMYAAKILGRGRVARYDEAAREVLARQTTLSARVDELIEHNRRLRSEARTDALTGLPNRRAMTEVEAMRVGDAGSTWSRCSVLFIDVDHFGRFNKRYGDQAGDEALKLLATALRHEARNDDLVFRKGGEEFVIVLPQLDLRGGAGVAERMREQVQALAVPHEDGTEAGVLTISVTVCAVQAGGTIGEAVAEAGDAAMVAKADDRRNAVTLVP